jgi:hypothetical protein
MAFTSAIMAQHTNNLSKFCSQTNVPLKLLNEETAESNDTSSDRAMNITMLSIRLPM